MRVFDELAGLVSNKINVVKTLFELISLETRLAGLSIFPLLLNICMLFVILITLWLSTMVLIGFGLSQLYHNPWISIGSVMLVNILFLAGSIKYLKFNLKNISFAKTREYLSGSEDHHGKPKTTDQIDREKNAPLATTTTKS